MSAQALVLAAGDDVAVALVPLIAGRTAEVRGAKAMRIQVRDAIPFGHKVALQDVESGRDVRKLGHVIGFAQVAIRAGEHVHLHNLQSHRGPRA
jgi:altronate dehydratase